MSGDKLDDIDEALLSLGCDVLSDTEERLRQVCCELSTELRKARDAHRENTMLRDMLEKAFDEYIGEGEEPVSLDDSFTRLRDHDIAKEKARG